MTFEEVLQQASGMLQRLGRVSYRSLKRQFDLDDDYFEDLKEGLLYTHCERIEDDGCGFRWTGEPPVPTQPPQPETDSERVPSDAPRSHMASPAQDIWSGQARSAQSALSPVVVESNRIDSPTFCVITVS